MKNKKLQYLKYFIQSVFFIGYGMGLINGFMKLWGFVLILALLSAALLGNFFCGWVCPFGAFQELIGAISSKIIKKKLRMPVTLQRILKYLKYILFLLIFIEILDFTAAFNSNHTFLSVIRTNSGQQISGTTTILAWCFLVLFIFLSIFFDRPFCNYICPNGVKYGLLSFMRVFTIKRNTDKCVNCKRCTNVCPMHIDVSKTTNVRHANCINCMKCIDSCPVKNTLKYGFCVKDTSITVTK